jgi:hypothetical protein
VFSAAGDASPPTNLARRRFISATTAGCAGSARATYRCTFRGPRPDDTVNDPAVVRWSMRANWPSSASSMSAHRNRDGRSRRACFGFFFVSRTGFDDSPGVIKTSLVIAFFETYSASSVDSAGHKNDFGSTPPENSTLPASFTGPSPTPTIT